METTYFVIHTRQQTQWEEAKQASGGTALTCVRIPQPHPRQGGGTVLWLDDYRPEMPEPEAPPALQRKKKMSRLEIFLDACATAAIVGLSIGLLLQFFI